VLILLNWGLFKLFSLQELLGRTSGFSVDKNELGAKTLQTIDFFLFVYFYVHLFTCAYIVWVISSPSHSPPPFPPSPPSVSGKSPSALITDFVEEKTYA
jgi:hypothetical protein